MRIIVTIALEKELPPQFKQQFPNAWVRMAYLKSGGIIQWDNIPFLVVIVGVGLQVIDSVQWLVDSFDPDEIINVGIAGSSNLALNQMVMIDKVTKGDDFLLPRVQCSLPIPYHDFLLTDCYTVPHIDHSIQQSVVDMEAYHVMSVCQTSNIDCVIFKYITDHNDEHVMDDVHQHLAVFHDFLFDLLSPLFFVKFDSVSVIIPVHNRPDQLTLAVDSVLKQTRSPAEIFVVDDGSDVSVSELDSSVSVLYHDSNLGVSAARNFGIESVSSDWIAFLDSDDVWAPNHLDSLMNFLISNPLYRFAQSEESWIRNGKYLNKKKYHQKPDGWGFFPSLDRCLISPSAVIIHKSLFEYLGIFDTSLTVCEDYDLWLRFTRYFRIGLSKCNTMTKYGGHHDQLSNTYEAMDNYRLIALVNLFFMHHSQPLKDLISNKIYQLLHILRKGALKRDLHVILRIYDDIEHTVRYSRQLNVDIYQII